VHLNYVWVPAAGIGAGNGISPAPRLHSELADVTSAALHASTRLFKGPGDGRVHVLSGLNANNNMVYTQDLAVGKVAAMKLDPASGEMKAVFTVDDRTTYVVAFSARRKSA
jgi:hypothetical protein